MNSEKEREAFAAGMRKVAEIAVQYGTAGRTIADTEKAILSAIPTLSTEAQPEVTGAVAEVDADDNGLFVEILYGDDGSQLKIGDKLYLPSAIEAAVREKLEEVREVIALLEQSAEPFDSACMKLRALIESPQPGVEEPTK